MIHLQRYGVLTRNHS